MKHILGFYPLGVFWIGKHIVKHMVHVCHLHRSSEREREWDLEWFSLMLLSQWNFYTSLYCVCVCEVINRISNPVCVTCWERKLLVLFHTGWTVCELASFLLLLGHQTHTSAHVKTQTQTHTALMTNLYPRASAAHWGTKTITDAWTCK